MTLRDLYETRMIFEPEAAALACKRASDEEIAHILKLGEKCQDYLSESVSGQQRIESEIAFHGALIRASHNEFIGQFLPVLAATIEKTFVRYPGRHVCERFPFGNVLRRPGTF